MTLAKRALVVVPLVLLALLAAFIVATQDVAAARHYPPAFGRGLAEVGLVRLYPPWAIADWYPRFGRADPRAFDHAGLWGLRAGLPPLLLAILAGAWRGGKRQPATDHTVPETTMPSQPDQSTSPVRALNPAWRNVLPVAAPGCSQGTPYSFWVRQGDPKWLAVVFGGGGACWSGENCALHGRPFYRPFAGLEDGPNDGGGIFDAGNPENPLAAYTIVFLPTANGDVFLGDSVTTYDTPAMGGQPASKISILHKGYRNATAALDWMFGTYPDPSAVAVLGWSAGAIASPLYTHIVAQHYPDALVTHFADGGGAYRVGAKLAPLLKSWGTATVLRQVPGFEDLGAEDLSWEDLYVRAAVLHPEITFHQYNERHDDVQALFMRLMGVDAPDVAANLDEAHAYIRARAPNFRTYTSWGRDEAIIGGYYDAVLATNALDNRGRPHVLDRFYTRQTNGVRFLDWFTAAITGKSVEDVACVDCETPEHHWRRPAFPG